MYTTVKHIFEDAMLGVCFMPIFSSDALRKAAVIKATRTQESGRTVSTFTQHNLLRRECDKPGVHLPSSTRARQHYICCENKPFVFNKLNQLHMAGSRMPP